MQGPVWVQITTNGLSLAVPTGLESPKLPISSRPRVWVPGRCGSCPSGAHPMAVTGSLQQVFSISSPAWESLCLLGYLSSQSHVW